MDWSSISNDIVAATLVNILFTIIITGLVVALGRLIWRRSVRTFFGVQPKRGSISVYLSNIHVNPRGTTGTSEISEGFSGTAITEIEYHYALNLAKSVETKPFYRAIRAFDPGDLFTPAQPIVCKVHVSPTMKELGDPQAIDILQVIKERVGDGSIVMAGAPIYNAFTLYCMNKLGSRFEFIRDKPAGSEAYHHGIRISHPSGSYDNDYIRGPVKGSGSRIREYYIIEKLSWPESDHDARGKPPLANKSKLFICAGTCSAATAAALQTLADRWRRMAEIQQEENFGLLCEIVLDHKDQRESYPPASELRIRDHYNMPGLA